MFETDRCPVCLDTLDGCSCSWLQTCSGTPFFVDSPRPEDVRIEDVARALSLQNRFAGHLPHPYSVARHSLLVAKIVEMDVGFVRLDDRMYSVDVGVEVTFRQIILAGLLHDATEAYLVDLPRPIKEGTPLGFEYTNYEDSIREVVEARFGLPNGLILDRRVKRADDVALATEARDLGLLARARRPWHLVGEPLPREVAATAVMVEDRRFVHGGYSLDADWQCVERAFLSEFERLGGRR